MYSQLDLWNKLNENNTLQEVQQYIKDVIEKRASRIKYESVDSMKEFAKWYKNKPSSVWSNEEKANHLIECSLGIEKQIMKYCKLKPEDINDVNIKEYIENLKIYNI